MTVATISHIFVDDSGVARIGKTRFKVIHLVGWMHSERWSAEDLLAQFPQLSPAQVHAALAYYYDHKSQIDEQIAAEGKKADAYHREFMSTPVAQKLRDLKRRS